MKLSYKSNLRLTTNRTCELVVMLTNTWFVQSILWTKQLELLKGCYTGSLQDFEFLWIPWLSSDANFFVFFYQIRWIEQGRIEVSILTFSVSRSTAHWVCRGVSFTLRMNLFWGIGSWRWSFECCCWRH